MANDNQNESALPTPSNNKRSSADLLPRFFRSESNKKFLSATLDQLTQPGVAEKINGYFGRKTAKAFIPSDSYVNDVSLSRENYQFEPAAVIKDELDNVIFYSDYNDYINSLKNSGANVSNHSKLNSQESYAWNPNIDWDKISNFRQYYWLPNGPQPVAVRGQSREVQSTYTVTLSDEGDNQAYVFTPNGLTRNPTLKLYRGQTYRFEIDTPGHPMAFALSRTFLPGTALVIAGTEGVRAPGIFDSNLYDESGSTFDVSDFFITPDVYNDFADNTISAIQSFQEAYKSLNTSDTLISNKIGALDTLRNNFDLNALSKELYFKIIDETEVSKIIAYVKNIYSTLGIDYEDDFSTLQFIVNHFNIDIQIANLYFGKNYPLLDSADVANETVDFTLYNNLNLDLVKIQNGRLQESIDLIYDHLNNFFKNDFNNETQVGVKIYQPNIDQFKVVPSAGSFTLGDAQNVSTLFPDGISNINENGDEVAVVYVEKGTIEFTIPDNAPDRLFYISKNDINTSGLVRIYNIEENSFLDVGNEILGKKDYTSANGVKLSNGMKVYFQGDVTPEIYENNEWYVEGVGDRIQLIKDTDLIIPSAYSADKLVPFDSNAFDVLPFDNASAYASEKDYIVSNRASRDKNPWARYNKWFHKEVISQSAIYNNQPVLLDEGARAKRPIIEFEAGIKLNDFGSFAKENVDLVDTFTKDVFSTIEGTPGYNIDGVSVAQGMRILFTADPDILVNGKIYKVNFVQVQNENQRQISLVEVDDSDPQTNEVVFATSGEKYAGKAFYYDGTQWIQAQDKLKVNQSPVFDVFDNNGISYNNETYYGSTTFAGTKIFSYKEGDGTNDVELGFPLSYKNIENSGDILFEFNLVNDVFNYQDDDGVYEQKIDTGYLKKYKSLNDFDYVNGYSRIPNVSKQYAVVQYIAEIGVVNNFEVNQFDKAGNLNDLKVNVYKNNQFLHQGTDYEIDRINGKALVRLFKNASVGDLIKIKADSSASKNQNGFYEFPYNLERNPLNEDLTEFTLGEVLDHVDSMIGEIPNFEGVYPGDSNLRDLGELDHYGRRFAKHSGPINLPLYHLTNKKYNIINSIRYSKREYARFKRIFFDTANTLGFDGPTKQHVDRILRSICFDKVKTQPFYFSDMLAYGPSNVIEYEILDSRTEYYALTENFSLNSLSSKSVYVYLNDRHLTHGKDYTFSNDGYVIVSADKNEGDILYVYEFDTSDGSWIPPTPTKLGLYPKYEPSIFVDDTYQPRSLKFSVYSSEERNFDIGIVNSVISNSDIKVYYEGSLLRLDYDYEITLDGTRTVTFFNPLQPGTDNIIIEIPYAVIQGHDGSIIRAFDDFRDNLFLELELRIYNNIKTDYENSLLDINDFVGGMFRDTGFTKNEIDTSLLTDFTDWLGIVDNDYTDHYFYDSTDEFTFNYSSFTGPDDVKLSGYWRSIYKQAYDTDRPHTHPWEMLGFTIKPKWWNEVYGPAPYTRDNLILWEDLEAGRIREPNKTFVIKEKYIRPNLTDFIPVDSAGKLVPPLRSGLVNNFFFRYANQSFVFGDETPVETSWRRSSEYPFALITAYLLNNPAKVMGLGFDTSRVKTNLANQSIYANSNKHIKLDEILFPNTANEDVRVNTSGLVNYVYNLIASDVLSVYEDYQTELKNLKNQIGFKIAGFSSKDKFKLILDSKTPLQTVETSNVFVPDENYQIFLNTSSPVDVVNYSGVIVEKSPGGYIIKGYDQSIPYFNYYPYQNNSKDLTVVVGGVSEGTVEWSSNSPYTKGQIIEQGNNFYRVVNSFTSGLNFDTNNLAKLEELPIVGGKRAIFRSKFNKRTVEKLYYGTKFSTSQEVVDFLLGYGEYLKDLGFEFNYFNQNTEAVENYSFSAREFLFWTTQGWASGTTIALSPGANEIVFKPSNSVVDNLFDEVYPYSIVKADGRTLEQQFVNIQRIDNTISVKPVNTDEGIYNIAFPLVQKEHAVLIDNQTVFNDTIYHPATGYRQERIRVNGYRSDGWSGGLNIPGFIYDEAKVTTWTEWKDYRIGDLVKFKEFYYVAVENISGADTFDFTRWYRINEKPVSELNTNFDYRINQFTDFYDLDSDNFDTEQQRLAQHLIGYQKRTYLANIINDDVSQYKFYQGMIQDKGTKNAISKLFDSLSNSNQDGLEYYEEWGIQVGRFGATDNLDQIEINFDESKFLETPQKFELVETKPTDSLDKAYRITASELYDKPLDYNNSLFPTTPLKEYLMTGGYVNDDEVDFRTANKKSLRDGQVDSVGKGDNIWLIDNGKDDWDVLQHNEIIGNAVKLEFTGVSSNNEKQATITLSNWPKLLKVGDFIGIKNATKYNLKGFYEVTEIAGKTVTIIIDAENSILRFANENLLVTVLRSVRTETLDDFNNVVQQEILPQQRIWIDDYNGDWAVLENNPVYNRQQTLVNPGVFDNTDHNFTNIVEPYKNNNDVFVTAPGDGDGIIYRYNRTLDTANLVDRQTLISPTDVYDQNNSQFGSSISLSPDGKYLAVGVPYASDVRTKYLGAFDPDTTYTKNDVINYRESLWKVNREILPQTGSQEFSTFDSYVDITSNEDADSSNVNLLITGDPGLSGNVVDHLLVRAPKDMYIGADVGDTIHLYWNTRSYAFPTLDTYLPFDGNIPEITADTITQDHIIQAKIDHVLYVDTYITLPEIGQRVTTETGSAEVFYVSTRIDSAVIYVTDTNGIFDPVGELYLEEEEFIGFYTEEDTINFSDSLDGFWFISLGFTYSNRGSYYDIGRGLVYADLIRDGELRDQFVYDNIQRTVAEIGPYIVNKDRASIISNLSYFGDPGGIEDDYLTNKFVIRASRDYLNSTSLTIGDQFEFSVYTGPNTDLDLAIHGFTPEILNNRLEVADIWNGYIDLEYTRFDFSGNVFELQVGDIIQDVQTPNDGSGGLAVSPLPNTSKAEVVFYQRRFNSVRVYLAGVTGEWAEASGNIGRYEIKRLARNATDVDRVVGEVKDPDNDIVLANQTLGKFLVIEADSLLPVVDNPNIYDQEYTFYDETISGGITRGPNPPYSLNKDYTQVYNITGTEFGTGGYDNEGAVAIYYKADNGDYLLLDILASEYSKADRNFGKKVKITKNEKMYTLFVSSNSTSENDPGIIEIFKHGVRDSEKFRGQWRDYRDYEEGEVVSHLGNFYRALDTILADNNIELTDTTEWEKISFSRSKDENYRGLYDPTYSYRENAIVVRDSKLWRANTNIAAGVSYPSFETSTDWTELESTVDWLGTVPNLTDQTYQSLPFFDPALTIDQFADNFLISDDGEVMFVVTKLQDVVGKKTLINIYRLDNERYVFDQTLDLNDYNSFAEKIEISPNGKILVTAESLDDERETDQGKVLVFRQDSNGQFTLDQTLLSPNNEISEKFGYNISMDNNILAITSLNGNMSIPTSFDEGDTQFDLDFTSFEATKIDSGVVYIFETISNKFIYSEQFKYDYNDVMFGQNIFVNDNHVFVGMPYHGTDQYKGVLLDYRKPKNKTAWNIINQALPTVDTSKIQGAFLWSKKENKILSYVDFIDPIQGKIAGIADQNIEYKTAYDPAKYSDSLEYQDKTHFWADKYVGKVWWKIDSVKFAHPYQGDVTFQAKMWNTVLPGTEIVVCEWVESTYLPSEWDRLSDTDEGIKLGISGLSLYGDDQYSKKFVYDKDSQSFSPRYYFWVRDTRVTPHIENRTMSAFDIRRLIENPEAQGYRYLALLSDNRFVLYNCDSLITDKDTVLNIRYQNREDNGQNIHSMYQILSENNKYSKPNTDIERKWFDSLIGFDDKERAVPDYRLPVKQKYGIQNRPRQGMFVNRFEALKQVIERVNTVLSSTVVVDEFNINPLMQKEELPTFESGQYDVEINTLNELRFVSSSRLIQAKLTPVIINGKLKRIIIDEPGRGYRTVPSYKIQGTGNDAEIDITLDSNGSITSVTIINDGFGYDDNTRIDIRPFTVLVESDDEVYGKWSLYSWDATQSNWFRRSIQDYDVTLFWNYVDWYAPGFNQFTVPNFIIEGSYQLDAIDDSIGDIIKIKNVGSGGWLLLEKIASEEDVDYTVNYNTIGRQDGTIVFLDTLYDYTKNTVGLDNRSFDSYFFDNNPSKELRIILETIRDELFTKDFAVEYNKLFVSSLRYVLNEQQYVDWLFKTSFIKIKHNIGKLDQDITYDNNTLPSYEEYVNEVKPYKVNIREFVSSYDNIEDTNTAITDFDYAPFYLQNSKVISTNNSKLANNSIIGLPSNAENYPRKFWTDNNGYQVEEIIITDGGSGYTRKPRVIIEGNGTGATAEAYLGYGKVTKVVVTNPGKGYYTQPVLRFQGPLEEGGYHAVGSVILGRGLVRTPTVKVKFDRTGPTYYYADLETTENFTGTNVNTKFLLEWPMNLDNRNVKVYLNGIELLSGDYDYTNITDKSKSYTRTKGQITFSVAPALGSNIVVEYVKDTSILSAADRIQFDYTPEQGMLGKDLAQLMTGVDYGGVEITSFDFDEQVGYGSDPWYTGSWDNFDSTFEDEVFIFDGSTTAVELTKVLENDIEYNVYLRYSGSERAVRIDDPNYGTPEQTIETALMESLQGDGITQVIDFDQFGITFEDGDVLTIRKITSDGSKLSVSPELYDTSLSGGDIAYQTATGINAEDIIVDGDGFITPTTSGGPEELVPGHVLDTLDIKVYTRDSGGQGLITSQTHKMTADKTVFDLDTRISSRDSVFIKINDRILGNAEYAINWQNYQITLFTNVPGADLTIIAIGQAGQDIADYGQFVAASEQVIFVTTTIFDENASIFVTKNGVKLTEDEFSLTQDESEDSTRYGVIELSTPAQENDVINYVLFTNDDLINYSQITKDEFIGDGTSQTFTLNPAPFYAQPSAYNVLVKVNNRILNAGYNREFIIPETRDREYALETFQQPGNILQAENIVAFINGEEILTPTQWRFDIFNSSVVLSTEIGNPGDLLEVYVIGDGDYTITDNTITLAEAPADGETIEIFKFSNHNVLGIERINYDVVARSTLIREDLSYQTYQRLTVGEIQLRKPAYDAQYVWVAVNGDLLRPSVDYYVTEDRMKVRLITQPEENDVIDIIHFAGTRNVEKFAFRQFKDMLNRTHYKRLDSSVARLTSPLRYYDLIIEVDDASLLPEPDKARNRPGIVFIDKERIEYFVKDGNKLRQLRRGTLGTGTKNEHLVGAKLFAQNADKNIPYMDKTLTQTIRADGSATEFVLDFVCQSVNEFEIFVAGKRLRKSELNEFDKTLALDSPEGDIVLDPEFTFDVDTNKVILNQTPITNTEIKIIKKIGTIWSTPGKTLAETENDIGSFIRSGTTELPE